MKVAALQAGDIDIIWNLPLDEVKKLTGRSGLRVESVPTGSWDAAIMNNLIPPFNDVRVRRAFNYAVDKRDLVDLDAVRPGRAHHQPDPAASPFFARDIVIRKADPAAARKLLAEAGHPNGLSMIPIICRSARPAANASASPSAAC